MGETRVGDLEKPTPGVHGDCPPVPKPWDARVASGFPPSSITGSELVANLGFLCPQSHGLGERLWLGTSGLTKSRRIASVDLLP